MDVGSQVTGVISKLEQDPRGKTDSHYKNKIIEWNSPVCGPDSKSGKPHGTVMARIDDRLYKAAYDQAKANLAKAQADQEVNKARLVQSEADWSRAQQLRPDLDPKTGRPKMPVAGTSKIAPAAQPEDSQYKAMADSDFDAARATYLVAKATIDDGEATIKQQKALLDSAKATLDYCTIESPVDGVVVDRRVNVGQTVVSAMSASSLFLIAQDLREIQVWASVNEADIGRIKDHEGMNVRFTCDAFPKTTFKGKVEEVRLNATMTQNVVTYTVVVGCDNRDLKLMPYLTANLQFEVDHRHNVLQVPNAALRWKPRKEQVVAEFRDVASGKKRDKAQSKEGDVQGKEGKAGSKEGAVHGKEGKAQQKAPGEASQAAADKEDRESHGRLWVKDEDGLHVRPVEVQVGVVDSNASMTEVSGPDVKDGMEVVVGETRQENADGDETSNPFAPKIFKKTATKKSE